MSLGKLKRTLHRELTKNPMKTGTLLALLPVAGYFILPLVWKQVGPSKSNASEPPSFVAAAATGAIVAVTGPQAPASWKDVARWMAQDVRTKPAHGDGLRNPFQDVSIATKSTEDNDPQESIATATPAPSPEDLGLQLNATIIGSARRLATINGRLYPENSKVQISQSNASDSEVENAKQSFVLKTVAKNYVMLERDGQLFRLQLAGSQPN